MKDVEEVEKAVNQGVIKIDQLSKSEVMMIMVDPCTLARAAAKDPSNRGHVPFAKMCNITSKPDA